MLWQFYWHILAITELVRSVFNIKLIFSCKIEVNKFFYYVFISNTVVVVKVHLCV